MSVRYGLVIDLERCIGCQTCTVACQAENCLEGFSGINVRTVGGQFRDCPAGKHPDLSMHFLPMICMHCDAPPCVEVCPANALVKLENGVVIIDNDLCDKCQICVDACPYGAIVVDQKNESVFKCSLCIDRIVDELDPFCVVCCETEAIYFGDLNDPLSRVSDILQKRKAAVLKPELDTRPAVYYLPTKTGRIV